MAALAGCALACSTPTYDPGQKGAPDAGPPDSALPGETGEGVPPTTDQPGRVAVPSAASFDVMPGHAVSGTLALSNATLSNVATVCTASLCATGNVTP